MDGHCLAEYLLEANRVRRMSGQQFVELRAVALGNPERWRDVARCPLQQEEIVPFEIQACIIERDQVIILALAHGPAHRRFTNQFSKAAGGDLFNESCPGADPS